MEFLDNGTLIYLQSGFSTPVRAKYSFLNDGRMLVEGTIFGINTGEAFRVEIVENAMTLTNRKGSEVFNKAR